MAVWRVGWERVASKEAVQIGVVVVVEVVVGWAERRGTMVDPKREARMLFFILGGVTLR